MRVCYKETLVRWQFVDIPNVEPIAYDELERLAYLQLDGDAWDGEACLEVSVEPVEE